MCVIGSRIHSIGSYNQVGNDRLSAVTSAAAAGVAVDTIVQEDIIDLNGKRVIPGLHDAHIHVYELGRLASTLNLEGCSSIEEFQQRIKEWCIAHPVPIAGEVLHAGFVEGNHW